MNIKIGDEYLDFAGEFDVEKQAKLFEDISSVVGSFSYQFEIPITNNNRRILGIDSVNRIEKPVYQRLSCVIESNGNRIYIGFLVVESVTENINASFYTGNSEWINQLDGSLRDLYLNDYTTNLNDDFVASWQNTTGVIYPVIDNGSLQARTTAGMQRNELWPCIYVHTIMDRIFNEYGVKLSGELVEDKLYKSLVICNADQSIPDSYVNDRSAYAGSSDLIQFNLNDQLDIDFANDFTNPFYDGILDRYNAATSEYTIENGNIFSTLRFDIVIELSTGSWELYRVRNGIPVLARAFVNTTPTVSILSLFSTGTELPITDGDVFSWQLKSLNAGISNLTTRTIKITPLVPVSTPGVVLVPDISKKDFVGDIFKMFNVVCSYDSRGIINTALYKNLRNRQAVDISDYVSTIEEVNYTEFLQEYGIVNNFSYEQNDTDNITVYNSRNFVQYGNGQLEISNRNLEPETDVVQLNASAPYNYINAGFLASFPQTNAKEIEDGTAADFTSVVDNAGTARFTFPVAHGFTLGSIIKIEDAGNIYNGEYIATSIPTTTTLELLNVTFTSTTTGTATSRTVSNTDANDFYYLAVVPNIAVNKFSLRSSLSIAKADFAPLSVTSYNTVAYGYFMKQGLTNITNALRYGLAWQKPNDPSIVDISLLDNYYSEFSRMLQDPVILRLSCNLPESIFIKLESINPVRLNLNQATGLYYLNRITGYKDSSKECEVELIKL